MATNTLSEEQHERADHNLHKAVGILCLLSDGGNNASPRAIDAAAWAVRDLIEEARDLYGKY